MKTLRLYLISFIFALISHFSFAQSHHIEVTVDGISDTIMMLGHHFGDKKYVIDTVMTNAKGTAVFEGDKTLEKGIYLLILPSKGNMYFEFLVDDDQKFSLHTKPDNYVKNMKIKGSKTNQAFNQYQRKMSELQTNLMKYNNRIKALGQDADSTQIYKDLIAENNSNRKAYMEKVVADNSNNLFGKIIRSVMDPEIPEPPKDANGNITDSSFQYRYFRKHFFDNIDFSERGLLRTPIYQSRIDHYFKNFLPPEADSIIPEVNALIEKSREDSLVFQFTTSHLLNYFETSKIMGMDEVFANIAETWYLSGEAYWIDDDFKHKIDSVVRKITPNILGEIAPDIAKVPTYNNEYASLHAIDAKYTILVFWEPNCGHCKKIVPKLHTLYKDTLKAMDIEVFAVYTHVEKEEWVEFIEDKEIDLWYNVYDPYRVSNFHNNYNIYSTPVIYVLDRNKHIIAKRIDVDKITKFIEFYEKREEQKKQKN